MSIPTRVAAREHIANVANVPAILEPLACTGCGFPLVSGACSTAWCDFKNGTER